MSRFSIVMVMVLACDRDDPIAKLLPEPLGPQNATPTAVPSLRVTPVPCLAPDSFVVVVPRTLRTAYAEHVFVSLFNADQPVSGDVRLTLFDETVSALVEKNNNVKRFEVAGRKVILYTEDMMPGETGSFEFQARTKYPVRAKEAVSQVYS